VSQYATAYVVGSYGVATISRPLQIIALFWRISSVYMALLEKRHIILRRLLIVATPYVTICNRCGQVCDDMRYVCDDMQPQTNFVVASVCVSVRVHGVCVCVRVEMCDSRYAAAHISTHTQEHTHTSSAYIRSIDLEL